MVAAAAVSHHPVAADAAGEVLGEVLERVGLQPGLVLVAASGDHREFLGEVSHLTASVLRPRRWVCLPAPVVSGGTDAPGGGIGMLAVSGDRSVVDRAGRDDEIGLAVDGRVLVDGIPTDTDRPVIRVGPVGPLRTAPTTQGLGPGLVVTDVDGPYLRELAGQPALGALEALAAAVDAGTRRLFARHLLLVVGDGTESDVRSVRGADRKRGVLALDRPVAIGDLVRFHVRDPRRTGAAIRAQVSGAPDAVLVVGDLAADDEAVAGERGPVSSVRAALGCDVLGLGGVRVVGPTSAGRSTLLGELTIVPIGPVREGPTAG